LFKQIGSSKYRFCFFSYMFHLDQHCLKANYSQTFVEQPLIGEA